MQMKIHLVQSSADLKAFITFQRLLYQNNPNFVPSLDKMDKAFFNPSNPMAEDCDTALWLVKQGKDIKGRIAGIINRNFNASQNKLQSRFTHFDCVEDVAVAHLLFQTAQDWAVSKGMTEMVGPFGFNNLDKHGLLVEGFDELACQSSNYNFPYYRAYVESFGFVKKHDWVERVLKVSNEEPPKIKRFSTLLKERNALSVVDVSSKKIIEAYTPQILDLYNTTYASLYGVSPLNDRQKSHLLKSILSAINADFVSIVVNDQDDVVAFGIAMLSFSRSLQKANGKLFPFGFFSLLRNHKNNRVLDLLLIGIRSDFQRKGLNAIVFSDIYKGILKQGIETIETTQNLDSNKGVQNLWSNFDSRLHKRARLYIKSLV